MSMNPVDAFLLLASHSLTSCLDTTFDRHKLRNALSLTLLTWKLLLRVSWRSLSFHTTLELPVLCRISWLKRPTVSHTQHLRKKGLFLEYVWVRALPSFFSCRNLDVFSSKESSSCRARWMLWVIWTCREKKGKLSRNEHTCRLAFSPLVYFLVSSRLHCSLPWCQWFCDIFTYSQLTEERPSKQRRYRAACLIAACLWDFGTDADGPEIRQSWHGC